MTRAVISLAFIFISLTSAFAQVTLDSGFGNSGIVITSDTIASEIICLAIQADDKIVAAGYSVETGIYHFRIARYNSNGAIDTSFGTNGIVNTIIHNRDMPYSMLLQPDGKIIVAGNYYDGTVVTLGNYHCAMVRYNTDGTLDNSFGVGGIVMTIINPSDDDMISSVALQPDGKIVAGGYAGYQFLLMRYNNDGTLDNSFGTGGKVFTTIELGSFIYSIAIQTDGKIVAAGTTGDISNYKFALARYNTDGTLDTSFGTGGTVTTDIDTFFYDFATSMALLPDGTILTGGYSDSNIALAKYNSDGTLDTGFGTGGQVTTNNYPPVPANSLALQTDGKIIVSGSALIASFNYGFSLSRFNADGTPDNSFGNAGNILTDINTGNDYAQGILLQPDGKIVVGGSSSDTSTSSPASFTLARFTSDLTGINDIHSFSPYWIIFPNPAYNHFNIVLGGNNKKVELTITDITGKIIYTTTATEKQKVEVNTKDFAEGVYIVQIHTSDFAETKKLIVTK